MIRVPEVRLDSFNLPPFTVAPNEVVRVVAPVASAEVAAAIANRLRGGAATFPGRIVVSSPAFPPRWSIRRRRAADWLCQYSSLSADWAREQLAAAGIDGACLLTHLPWTDRVLLGLLAAYDQSPELLICPAAGAGSPGASSGGGDSIICRRASASQGNYTEAAISIAGDAAMVMTGGISKLITTSAKGQKVLRVTAASIEGSIAGYRVGQGAHKLYNGDGGYGELGEALLRVFGLKMTLKSAAKRTPVPKVDLPSEVASTRITNPHALIERFRQARPDCTSLAMICQLQKQMARWHWWISMGDPFLESIQMS